MGARDEHTLKTFIEAEAYDGPSLIIAYSHCISHGIDMTTALQHQKSIVEVRPVAAVPLQSRSRRARRERAATRFARDQASGRGVHEDGEPLPRSAAPANMASVQHDVDARWKMYSYLSTMQPAPAADSRNREKDEDLDLCR